MPLTKKGKKIMKAMKKQYGKEKGEEVFYASANKGRIKGVHEELTKEDIEKYATEKERKILEERRWRTSPPEQAVVRKIKRIQRLLAELSVSDEMVELSISTPDSVYRDLEKAQDALAKFASHWREYAN